MRHGKAGKKLGRDNGHRKAMIRTLVTQLFTHGRIRTTEAKAKALRVVADEMVTLAKQGDLHARRRAMQTMTDKKVVARLFETVAPWYEKQHGGYTRVLKLGPRPGDNSPMAFIELVDRRELGPIKTPVPPKKKFKKKGGSKAETENSKEKMAKKKEAKKKADPKADKQDK